MSERNLRYGLHFMYSDDCRYVGNTFRHNGSGVAVMYTQRVEMIDNRFEYNWGSAAYGLLLKEISDARLERQPVRPEHHGRSWPTGPTGSSPTATTSSENGWAVKLEASTVDGELTRQQLHRQQLRRRHEQPRAIDDAAAATTGTRTAATTWTATASATCPSARSGSSR